MIDFRQWMIPRGTIYSRAAVVFVVGGLITVVAAILWPDLYVVPLGVALTFMTWISGEISAWFFRKVVFGDSNVRYFRLEQGHCPVRFRFAG